VYKLKWLFVVLACVLAAAKGDKGEKGDAGLPDLLVRAGLRSA
jgi:hypothetical protein